VVNRFGFSHEVPNLGVLGASVMGTSGAHNPTLTAQALAWRTAEHLTANWKAIAKGSDQPYSQEWLPCKYYRIPPSLRCIVFLADQR
jgi:choline dehydrogenase-like flavoprotein